MTVWISAATTVSDLSSTAYRSYSSDYYWWLDPVYNPGKRLDPSVAVAGDGSLAVAWTEMSAAYDRTASLPAWNPDLYDQWIYESGEIVARVLGADGLARGTTFQVNTAFYGLQHRPQVVAQADGDFFVAFTSSGVTGGDFFPPLPVQGPPGEPTRGQLPPFANVLLYTIAAGPGQPDATPVANFGLTFGAEVFERAIDLDLDANGNAVATLVNGIPTRLTTFGAPWVIDYSDAPVSVRTPDFVIGSAGREVNADIITTVQTAVLTGGQIVTAGGYGTLGGVFPFVTNSVNANPLYFHIDGSLPFRLDNAVPAHDPRFGVSYSMEGIAALADGGFVLLFQQAGRLFAQAYNANGTERAEPVQISSRRVEVVDVIGLKDGGLLFAYHGYLSTGWPEAAASFAILASDGTLLRDVTTPLVYVTVNGGFTNIGTDLDLALTPTGDAVVAWSDGYRVHVATLSGIVSNRPPTGLDFTSAVPGIAEDASPGTVVGQLAGIDPDSTVFTYEVVDSAGNPASGSSPFAISGANLVVSGTVPLDYETAPLEQVYIKATDSSGNAIIRPIQVAIGDANEAPTGAVFTATGIFWTALDENPANGTYIGRIVGVDPDQGDTTKVAFWRDPVTGILFDGRGSLTMTSAGDLYVANRLAFDFEAGGNGFFVEVTDKAGAKATHYVAVFTNDVENERVTGTNQNDTILGGRGNDILNGLGGDDWLQGDQGFPYFGADSDDTLSGGDGNDTLLGGFGADRLLGQAGDDLFLILSDDMVPGETINGGTGFDTLRLESGQHSLFGVRLTGVEEIRMVGGAELELGLARQALLVVEASGSANTVTFDGVLSWTKRQHLALAGVETVAYQWRGLSVRDSYHPGPPLGVLAKSMRNDQFNTEPFTNTTTFFDTAGDVLYREDEMDDGRLVRTDYDPLGRKTNTLVTDPFNLFPFSTISTSFEPDGSLRLHRHEQDNGDQLLRGGAGANYLQGGSGNDRLTGGGGRDVFAVSPLFGADRVTDFEDGTDMLDLRNLGITSVAGIAGAGGSLKDGIGGLRIDFGLQGSLTVTGLNIATFGNADLV